MKNGPYLLLSFFSLLVARHATEADGESLSKDNSTIDGNVTKRLNLSGVHCSDDYSCPSQCTPVKKASKSCSCHFACHLFGDCCYNAEEYATKCDNSTQKDRLRYRNQITRYSQYFQCFAPWQKYWMVSKCPTSWKGHDLCSRHTAPENYLNLTVNDIELTNIPASSNEGILFRNIFCAVCHAVEIENIILWEIQMECYAQVTFESGNLTLHEIIQNHTDQCVEVKVIQPPNLFEHQQFFEVPCTKEDARYIQIDTCRSDYKHSSIEKSCHEIYAPILHNNSWFKNKYCVECNLSEEDMNLINLTSICDAQAVYDDFIGGLTSMTYTLNLKPSLVDQQITCKEGQVFDPFKSRCISLNCRDGFKLFSKSCVKVQQLRKDLPLCGKIAMNVTINFTGNSILNTCNTLINLFETYDVIHNESIRDRQHLCTQNNLDGIFQIRSSFKVDLFNVGKIPFVNFIPCKGHLMEDCKAFHRIITELSCEYTEAEPCNHSKFDSNHTSSDGIRSIDELPSILHKVYKVTVTFQKNNDDYDDFERNLFIQNCIPPSDTSAGLNCPMITLNQSLFRPLPNDSKTLLYIMDDKIILTQDQYRYAESGQILICNIFDKTGKRYHIVTFFQYSMAQAIISTAGLSISVFALMFSLITYVVFPTLRQQAGNILTMLLFITLMSAQISLLIIRVPTKSPVICAILAGLGHYLWLATFTTTSVLGYKLTRTFQNGNFENESKKPSCRLVIWHILPCLLLPAIFCLALLILKSLDLITFGYGNELVCWISGPSVNIYGFAAPVGICLLLNMIFFIFVTRSICIQQRERKALRSNQNKRKFQEYIIHVKIFIILGLSWIVGFIAAFTKLGFLWYIFIVLTSLQGFLIFLVFICKARILRMWMKYFKFDSKVQKSSPGKYVVVMSNDVSSYKYSSKRLTFTNDA
ncbi:uncharacterized protein [Apostichopus japonicus]|uniref:uncharacterized protein n=1 Tax=Stichopus japonicus TaxID=307972 RepID=UPI003AB6860E